jgi:hypothetical protein
MANARERLGLSLAVDQAYLARLVPSHQGTDAVVLQPECADVSLGPVRRLREFRPAPLHPARLAQSPDPGRAR